MSNIVYLKTNPPRLKTLNFEPKVNYALGYALLAVFVVVIGSVGYAVYLVAR